MNWTKASAIAEIVSSVAIVSTLAYLTVQTQQNAAATLSTARQATLNAELALLLKVIDKPELQTRAEVFLQDPNSLTAEERMEHQMILAAFFRVREHMYLQHLEGVLDRETWNSYASVIAQMMSREGAPEMWANAGANGGFDPRFVAAVNDIVAVSREQIGSPNETQ